jgi:hypothetical protein
VSKIVYLFGAGASKNALPLVNEIPGRLNNLIERLKSSELSLESDKYFGKSRLLTKTVQNYQSEMIDSLNWLLLECKRHASVDTLAKKLFIKKERQNLRRLKLALSLFFVCEQTINRPDSRYDSFFAAILNSLSKLPENIQIVSWNYDYQFEMSYSEYTGDPSISANQGHLQAQAKNRALVGGVGFGIYKLNGTTSLYSADGIEQHHGIASFGIPFGKDFVREITYWYAEGMYSNDVFSALSFSWEPEAPNRGILPTVLENSKDATAVVVIGYSFPFFNREVDRKIFGNMANLKRVYFQAPDADMCIRSAAPCRSIFSSLTFSS